MAICQVGIMEIYQSKMSLHHALRANRTTNHDTRTLNNLLWKLDRYSFEWEKPRDRIYALKGIASDVNDRDIQCDYKKDIKEVYHDLLNLLLDKMTTYTFLPQQTLNSRCARRWMLVWIEVIKNWSSNTGYSKVDRTQAEATSNVQWLVAKPTPACLKKPIRSEECNDFLFILQQSIFRNLHLDHPRHRCPPWLWCFDHPRHF